MTNAYRSLRVFFGAAISITPTNRFILGMLAGAMSHS